MTFSKDRLRDSKIHLSIIVGTSLTVNTQVMLIHIISDVERVGRKRGTSSECDARRRAIGTGKSPYSPT